MLVLIAFVAMSPVVLALIESSLKFEGDGVLYSATETLNDGSRMVATAEGPVNNLSQSTYMEGSKRQSQMILNSSYGGARIKTPEYNLRMEGHDIDASASLFRNSEETTSSLFPALKGPGGTELAINEVINNKVTETVSTTKLGATVYVDAYGANGSVDREIKLENAGKGAKTIADMTFKGRFNFSDEMNLSGIVIRKAEWQFEETLPVGVGDKL